MTALYFDTNLCCNDTHSYWTPADEGHVSLLARIFRSIF